MSCLSSEIKTSERIEEAPKGILKKIEEATEELLKRADESKEDNTKKRYRNFCFTSFLEEEPIFNAKAFKYMVFQREKCPKSGLLHWQGYAEIDGQLSMRQIKTIMNDKGIHIEPRRGSQEQAIKYCTLDKTKGGEKDLSPIEGTQKEFGVPAKQGMKIDDLIRDMIDGGKSLKEIGNEYPEAWMRYHGGITNLYERKMKEKAQQMREVKTVIHWGKSGTGKTFSIFNNHKKDDIYSLRVEGNDNIFFCGYEGETVLLIDDFYGNIPWSLLLKLLDGYPLNINVKGGHTWALWTTVYITSNEDPNNWYNQVKDRSALISRISEIIEFEGNDLRREKKGALLLKKYNNKKKEMKLLNGSLTTE